MANDIIYFFQKYASQLEWQFSYGNKANQNLLQSDLDETKKYLILDPVKRNKNFSEYGAERMKSFSGSFLLVVKSTLDQTYYNQTEQEREFNRVASLDGSFTVNNPCIEDDYKAGKYVENILPLIDTEIVKLEDLINCSDYKIDEWSIIDATDIFDTNLDGIIVNFKLSVL